MSESIAYTQIRAVHDETGASHEECRQVLSETGGDVAAAAALWFARKRGQVDPPRGRLTSTDPTP
jgi:translation elongation factor EF-Ts